MNTSVIGFPRIGEKRELKFALESYFKKETDEAALFEKAKELRTKHLQLQQKANITYIPVNDFSFYDNVLDTAFLFGIVPERYKALNLSDLDTYLAMARGYQGENGDVKALAMKKWFNTNYHYIVPEVEDSTVISLQGNKPLDEYAEAKALGIDGKLVITGAYTLLKLCHFTGKKTIDDIKSEVLAAYKAFVAKAGNAGVKWIQFDEPSLVRDLSAEDIDLFTYLYEGILEACSSKTLLQTYFGDVRDIYEKLITFNFDAIGLDFVEGKETAALVEKYGFPKNKTLFAGLICGKNIWKNNYEKTLKVLNRLSELGIDTTLSTSCSLLHVPYTLALEERLDEKYKRYFSYAVEKLEELRELADIDTDSVAYKANVTLFKTDRNCSDADVAKAVSELNAEDYVRLPKRPERQALQKKTFNLPLFPTTTIGSFPQTQDVKKARLSHKKGEISDAEYETFVKSKIESVIKWQEEIGLDVLVHGEYERNDMVEYFGQALSGYLFTDYAWVQSYGTRCVKPPIIWGDVSRKAPITVAWSSYAQSLTKAPVKGMLTGPVTILNWSFPREDISIKESIIQIALAIRDEVCDLEKAGIKIIQIDEAALREKLPLRKSDWYSEYLDFAIPAFRLVHSKVQPQTQIHTHMCYSEFSDIIKAIDDMDADVITFEASRSSLGILKDLKACNFETEVGPGVYDIHSPRVPSVQEITDALNAMLDYIPTKKLWVNPDCGLKTRGVEETKKSLINLVTAARELRKQG